MLKMNRKEVKKPILLFAFDNSESIILNADSIYYLTDFQKQCKDLMQTFESKYEVIAYSLGQKNPISHVNKNDFYLDFSEKTTALSPVFDELRKYYGKQNIGAMVMFTDGIFNVGTNPYYKAEQVNYPIYTVGLGNAELQTDLFIASIQRNETTFRGNFFPVEIKVTANKLNGNHSILKVYEKDKEIYSKNINISSTQFFENVKFSLEAKEAGIHYYRVVLDTLEGEINVRNNQSNFYIEVTDSREKIALIYHAPHPDISAIKQSLENFHTYETKVFAVQDFKDNPTDYSLIILHQLPSNQPQETALLQKIQNSEVPSLYVIGNQTNISQFNTLNIGLQIQQTKSLFNDAQPLFNDNFSSFTFSEDTRHILPKFPPLNTFFGNYKNAISSSIFMYQKISNVNTNYPLIMFNRNGNTNNGIIVGEGLWQWRMYNYLYAGNHDAFNEIIGKTVQLLSVKSDRSQFKVMTEKVFMENADIEFDAELYNQAYELVNEPEVNIDITHSNGKKYEARFSKKNNAYYLNMGCMPAGNYQWTTTANIGNQTFTKTGSFSVQKIMLESVQLTANHTLLKNMATVSGGQFYTPEHIFEIEQAIKNNENIKPLVSYEKKYGLMLDSWWYWATIIALLATEWFLRKWNGGY
jgi:hypothetical protein